MADGSGRLRLLHVITGLKRGGAERMLARIAGGLDQARFQSVVLSLTPDGSVADEIRLRGVPVFAVDFRNGRAVRKSMSVVRELALTFRPRRVVGWMYHGNLAAFAIRHLWCRQARVDWNIRCSLEDIAHFPRWTRFAIRLSGRLSGLVDSVTYNAKAAVAQHRRYGFNNDRAHVIPNGFDPNEFSYTAHGRRRIREEVSLPLNARVVGLICRYHSMKSHRTFVEAAAMVARDLDVYFLMAGYGVDWSNEELVSWITSAGIRDRVRLLGERTDIRDVVSAIDVACLTSTWGEGFPNILGEAMAVGVPCVTTDVGDAKAIVGDTGIAVQPGDHEAFAAGLRELLSMDPIDREKVGDRCRTRIRAEFSIERALARYEDLFQDSLR